MRAAAATENHGFGQFLCARQFLRHVAESLVETGDVLIRGLGFVELALALEIKRKVIDQIEQAVVDWLHAAEFLERHVELRSEEHTSELQSLMRISYAVFCLKKKKMDTVMQTYEH